MQILAYLVSHHRQPVDASVSADGTRLDAAGLEAVLASHGFTVVSATPFAGPGYAGTRRALAHAPGAGGTTADGRVPLQTSRAALAAELATDAAEHALVPAALIEAPRKLLVMDVDSTLIQQEVIELLAAHAGREAEVAAVTEAAMRGELDFAASLHARVATLGGLDAAVIDQVRAAVVLSEGARELVEAFHAAGHLVGVVSGGFRQILDPLAADLGLDFAQANDLGLADGVLTGTVHGDVVDAATKEACLRRWAADAGIPLEHTIAAGDGANDLLMVAAAGLGVAYRAKPALRAAADAVIDLPRLDVLRHLAGV
ncbi:phosphoserine phosphatase SerB [Arthrobacter sp. JSM 101049]|uniref:phosphoserine phosphatase SerB n=1 Tax=Arthrobacter sp. JSM 101049 TaxID=929097 RepID=UPI00356ADD8E